MDPAMLTLIRHLLVRLKRRNPLLSKMLFFGKNQSICLHKCGKRNNVPDKLIIFFYIINDGSLVLLLVISTHFVLPLIIFIQYKNNLAEGWMSLDSGQEIQLRPKMNILANYTLYQPTICSKSQINLQTNTNNSQCYQWKKTNMNLQTTVNISWLKAKITFIFYLTTKSRDRLFTSKYMI